VHNPKTAFKYFCLQIKLCRRSEAEPFSFPKEKRSIEKERGGIGSSKV